MVLFVRTLAVFLGVGWGGEMSRLYEGLITNSSKERERELELELEKFIFQGL